MSDATQSAPAPVVDGTTTNGKVAEKTEVKRETNVIKVGLQRSPIFYANLTKRFLHGGEAEVKLTGLGETTNTVVGATEMLKRTEGFVVVKKIETTLSERGLSRLLVVLGKGEKFDELYEEPPAREKAGKKEKAEAEAEAETKE
eukprot:NODE_6417_length_573_cov_18.227099_g6003_i0.p2 GENE.NODE_6417_length_573_cov_18.227099_g6003_i0~~NODE_6417_length_573_cov_18.227099_g6003_i0.p2  ORF type:complete len:144 (-),score=40.00 NODE_6417_length_573_cov_18.227099_g6003_i0:71-502(-)